MKLILKDVRLSFPQLWKAKEFVAADGTKSKPRYDATFLIVPGSPADNAIRVAIKAEAEEKWEKKAPLMLKQFENQGNKYCYMSGDLKDYDGYAGMMALTSHRAANKGKPKILDNKKDPETGKLAVLPEDAGRPYGGCYVNAQVDIYAQKGLTPGMRCSFVLVQYWREGDAFSGGSAPDEDEFEEDLSTEDSIDEQYV